MQNAYARIRLAEWGRWSRDDVRGYPRQSAVVGEYQSRSTGYTAEMPLHVAYVDLVVRQMDVEPRRVIIVHYTQSGTGREKASRVNASYGTYCRLLRQGQDHVEIELQYEDVIVTCAVGQKAASCR